MNQHLGRISIVKAYIQVAHGNTGWTRVSEVKLSMLEAQPHFYLPQAPGVLVQNTLLKAYSWSS